MERVLKRIMLSEYMAFLHREEKSRATIEKYIRDVEKLYQFCGGECLDKQKLIAFKNSLTEHYAAVSVNSMLAAVNSFTTFLGWPELRIKPLKIQKQVFSSESRELTKAEYSRLLQAAAENGNERLYLIMQTIGATGIGISELPCITAASLQSGQVRVSGKNKKRIVCLPKKLKKRLTVYVKKQGIVQGAVFVTRNQKPVSRSNIWKQMKALAEKAYVSPDKIFPHNLRHLFARTYYQMKKDIVMLAGILGHNSIETTRIYTMSTGREYARQIERLGLIL